MNKRFPLYKKDSTGDLQLQEGYVCVLRSTPFLSNAIVGVEATDALGYYDFAGIEINTAYQRWTGTSLLTLEYDETFSDSNGVIINGLADQNILDATDGEIGQVPVIGGTVGSEVFEYTGFPKFDILSVSQTGVGGYLVRGICLVSSTVGFAVCDGGFILTTTNAGNTWAEQTSGTTETLAAVKFISTTVGWVVGENGTILKTSNGGSSWVAQTSGVSGGSLNSVDFIDANTGWAVGSDGSNGVILKTTNGGTNWVAQAHPFPTGTTILSVSAVDSSNAFITGSAGRIGKTINGGTNWTALTSGVAQFLYDISAISVSIVYACGADGIILKTTDGGTVWSLLTSGTAEDLKSFAFTSATNGWVSGANGTILKTSDGTSWTAQTTPASAASSTLFGIFAQSTTLVLAGGTDYAILKTTDGGVTDWINKTVNVGRPIYSPVHLGSGKTLANPATKYIGLANYAIVYDENIGGSGAIIIPVSNFDTIAGDGSSRGFINFDSTTITAASNEVQFWTTDISNIPSNDIAFNAMIIILHLP